MNKIKKSTFMKILLLVVVVLLFVFVEPLNSGLKNMTGAFKNLESVKEYIKSFGGWAVAISIAMMILQSIVAPIPAFLITFANAAIWGWWKGAIISWSGAMIGAALCFGIARLYGRGVAEKFATKMALDDVEIFFEKYGKNAIFIARLLPFVPFDPISYAAGLTPMTFRGFFLATGLGQTPATIVYSYAAAKSSNPSTFVSGLLILFGVSALVYTARKIWMDKNKKSVN